MTKFRKSILIFGFLVLLIGAALGTFIVLSLTGSLNTEAIALEFTVEDAEKVYDGEPLKASGYSMSDGLIEGHSAVVTFTGEQTDVGYGLSSLDVKIVNESGFDVTKEYDIKVNPGLLTVNKSSLQVTVTTDEVIYDGNKVNIGDEYTTSGKLAAGHIVTLKIKDEWFEDIKNYTVAGETLTESDIEPLIVDANSRNVSGNYVVNIKCSVNILPRPLVIAPISASKTYDGEPLTCTNYGYVSGSLVSGHYITPNYQVIGSGAEATVTDANEDNPLEITAKTSKIYDLNGNDVTANYSIGSSVATLTVYKADLTIEAKSGSWDYDGKAHSFLSDNKANSSVGLARRDLLSVVYSGSVTDVSVAVNKIENYNILFNGEDKSGNYNITVTDGKLEITMAQLTVKWIPLDKQYDGKPFVEEDQDKKAEKDLYDAYSPTVAEEDFELKFEEGVIYKVLGDITAPVNSTYIVTDFEVYSSGGTKKITENFNITVIAGNIKIIPRDVSIKDSALSKKYDGNFEFTDNFLGMDFIAEGHVLVSITCNPISIEKVKKGESTTIKSIFVRDAQGRDVSSYYNITNFDSDIKVTFDARELSLKTKSLEKVYDGTALVGNNLTYGAIAAGDRIEYEPAEITGVGIQDNKPASIKMYTSNNEDVSAYYTQDWGVNNADIGKLEITARPLKIGIETIEGTYVGVGMMNGQDLTGLLQISNLADGDGDVEMKFCTIEGYNAAGKPILAELDSEYFPKLISLDTDNAKSAFNSSVTITNNGLEETKQIAIRLFKKNGTEVTGNYAIDLNGITGKIIYNGVN